MIDDSTVELSKTVVGAGVDITCAQKAYAPEWIKVYYGAAYLQAVYGVDYTVTLAVDFESYTVTPTASLVTKLTNLGEGMGVKVVRIVPDTTDFTVADAFVRQKLVTEFDIVAMRSQQVNWQFGFVPEDFATNIQSALDAVTAAQAAAADAQSSEDDAETAQAAAVAAQAAAATQATNAATSASSAATQATNAAGSATTAGTQATAAAGSATSAAATLAAIQALGIFLLHGTGAPSNAIGQNGWYYVDDAALKLYGPKAAGVWPAGVDMTAVNAVTGPGTAVVGSVAVFNNVNGKVLADSGRTPGAANGLATLDGSGQIPSAQLPAIAITDVFVVASQAAMLALTAEKGDVAIRSDLNKSFVLSTNSPGTLADWKELLTPTDAVLSVAGLTGAITASGLKTALAIAIADVASLQTTLDAKETLGEVSAINAQTGTTYTFVLTDKGKLVTLSNAGAITLTVPTNASVAFPVKSSIKIAQLGAGQVTISGAGVTFRSRGAALKLTAQYGGAELIKIATDEWLVVGDLTT